MNLRDDKKEEEKCQTKVSEQEAASAHLLQ
jgi:hypothetical protein